MEKPIGRYARDSEDYTGIANAANVLGAGVAHTIWASEFHSRKQAGHLIASDLVGSLLLS
jgi:hypothetical protein